MIQALADALSERGYDTLTAVQEAVTNPELQNADLLVSAQTGSGKTVGFGLAIAPISPRWGAKIDSSNGNLKKLRSRDVSKLFGHEQIVILRRRHRREPPHQKAFRETVIQSVH